MTNITLTSPLLIDLLTYYVDVLGMTVHYWASGDFPGSLLNYLLVLH